MKKSRFTESQIVAILREGEAGVSVATYAWSWEMIAGAGIGANPHAAAAGSCTLGVK